MRRLLPLVVIGCSVIPQRRATAPPPVVPVPAIVEAAVLPPTSPDPLLDLPLAWHGDRYFVLERAEDRDAFELDCLVTAPVGTPCRPDSFRLPDEWALRQLFPNAPKGEFRFSIHLKPEGLDTHVDLFERTVADGPRHNSCDVDFDIATGALLPDTAICYTSLDPGYIERERRRRAELHPG